MVEHYTESGMNMVATWFTPMIVLSIDKQARTVLLPGKAGTRRTVCFDDIRESFTDKALEHVVQTAIDSVDDSIEDYMIQSNGLTKLQR